MKIESGTKLAKQIVVIYTQTLRGEGVEENPLRLIDQYWSLDGELLAEKDEWLKKDP